MKHVTKLQKVTIVAILFNAIWEYCVKIWASGVAGPILRVDLLFVYPILAIMVSISLYQLLKK